MCSPSMSTRREKFKEPGWVEDYHEEPGESTWNQPRKKMPKDYVGRPTTAMTSHTLEDYEGKFKEWTERGR